jgi:hypothetical protein
MSEMVMFHDPATPVRHEGSVGVGAFGTWISNDVALRAWRDRDHAQLTTSIHTGPQFGSGGLAVAGFNRAGDFGTSFVFGAGLGFDVTAKLKGRNYVTAGYSVGHLLQGYVQHRAFNSRYVAAAVGVGGRTEWLALSVPCEAFFGCGPERRVASIGVRGLGLLRPDGAPPAGILVAVYAGYVPYVRRPLLSLSFIIGNY